ncbi:Death-associated inhibitor of apoptosis 2 [Carabus blaptoides fortunei]
MNNEESRLRTFSAWPSDAAVDPVRIAKAGFYYTGQGLEVQCFCCGGKITEWNYGDQVMAKHRRLDPSCPFVINPSTTGNVPKLTTNSTVNLLPPTSTLAQPSTTTASPSETVDSDRELYRTVSSRLNTFVDWPVPNIVSPEVLAKAGFYSLHLADKVSCAYCNAILLCWKEGDDPRSEHTRLFPQCPFVQSNFSLNEIDSASVNSNTKLVNVNNLSELGIQAHKGPRLPAYATLEARLRSFTGWSVDLIQTPDMLAEAGFYYVNRGDQVRCFHCDGGLRHWDPEDDPWVEHARWFPGCAFVRLVKGQEFIQSCSPEQQSNSLSTTVTPHLNGSVPPPRQREITDQEIQVYLSSPAALAALSIGLHVGRVKQAIRQKYHETGSGYTSPDALIEAALNLQLDESDAVNDSDVVLSQEVSNILSAVILNSKEDVRTHEELGTKAQMDDDKPVGEPRADGSSKVSLEEENRQLKEARLCKICMDNEIGVVFLPCGHLTTCVNCAPSLKDCPVCRSVIKGTVRTFLS